MSDTGLALWWAKRDLRLADNDVLHAALTNHRELLVVVIVEPSLWAAPDASWLQYEAWREAAGALVDEVRTRGGSACVRVGEAVEVMEALHASRPIAHLYAHEEIGTDITYRRDRAVRAWARHRKLPFTELPQSGVIRGLRDRSLRQPIIKARLIEMPLRPAPERLPGPSLQPSTNARPDEARLGDAWPADNWPDAAALGLAGLPDGAPDTTRQAVHEAAAQTDLDSFLAERGEHYSGGISSPNTAFTHGSRLSVHIAWGTVSLRTLHQRSDARLAEARTAVNAFKHDKSSAELAVAKRWSKSLRGFQARLHWHDHFSQRLESAPGMEFETLNPAYRDVRYDDDGTHLDAWCAGRTGHPMVDACIRCLRATGFVNFRMRAMLVTVGCFGLGIHWRELQTAYARLFRDYEPGIHYPQVQMQAGLVGINTLRVYSPSKQLLDQDPDATFVRRWIPELAEVAVADIRAYEKRPLPGYPGPLPLAEGNRDMKAQLYAIRRSAAGRAAAEQVLAEHGSRLPPAAREGTPNRRAPTRRRRTPDAQTTLDL